MTAATSPAFVAYGHIERAPWQQPEPTQREPQDVPLLDHPDHTQEPAA